MRRFLQQYRVGPLMYLHKINSKALRITVVSEVG